MSIKPADIILTKGTGAISELIEDITDSIYSHVAGVIKDNEIVEAMGFERTNYEGLDTYRGYADIFTCDILTDEQRLDITKYVETQVGGRYDYLLLLIEAIRYIFHVVLPYKQDFKNHICSTLWVDAYRSVGVDLCPGVRYPSPAEVSQSKLLRKTEQL